MSEGGGGVLINTYGLKKSGVYITFCYVCLFTTTQLFSDFRLLQSGLQSDFRLSYYITCVAIKRGFHFIPVEGSIMLYLRDAGYCAGWGWRCVCSAVILMNMGSVSSRPPVSSCRCPASGRSSRCLIKSSRPWCWTSLTFSPKVFAHSWAY